MRYFIDTSTVSGKDFARPQYEVLNPLATRVVASPQLQVLRCVVGLVAVFVVDRFIAAKSASQHLLHDRSVLKLPLATVLYDAVAIAVLVSFKVATAFQGAPKIRAGSTVLSYVLIVIGATALCPCGMIASRNSTSRAVGTLVHAPEHITASTQPSQLVVYRSRATRSRAGIHQYIIAQMCGRYL